MAHGTTAVALRVSPHAGGPAEWDEFVRGQDGWTHCHLAGWEGILRDVMGHRCRYLAATAADGSLQGVLPLVEVHTRLFGRYLVSQPFLNSGGPLGTPEAVRALTSAAVAAAEGGNVRRLELRSRVELPLELPASHHKVTVVLPLDPGSPETVWRALPSKVRSQVRRPAKEGVRTLIGADQVAPFYRVFARHMRDLGTPVMPRKYFERLAETFPESAWFGCAYLGDEPIAAGAGLIGATEFEMTWASSLNAFNRLSPNMGLYWAFMEAAANAGLSRFNFGRCTPGGGTHRFKRQWGGRDEALWWYFHPAGATPTPSPNEGRYSWGPRLWKRLPLVMANVLGPRIVRGIP